MNYTILNFTDELLLKGARSVFHLKNATRIDGRAGSGLAEVEKRLSETNESILILFHSLSAELARLEGEEYEHAIINWTKIADEICSIHKLNRQRVHILYCDELLLSMQYANDAAKQSQLKCALARYIDIKLIFDFDRFDNSSALNNHLDGVIEMMVINSLKDAHLIDVSRINPYGFLGNKLLVDLFIKHINDRKRFREEQNSLLKEQLQALEKIKTDYSQTQDENASLLSQLQKLQEELESVYLRKKGLKSESLSERARFGDLQQENELLLNQLHKVQEELEYYYLKTVEEKKDETRSDSGAPVSVEPTGIAENHQSRPSMIKRHILFLLQGRHLRKSKFFDSEWYLNKYPDVRTSGMDPVRHYFLFGADEGRDPSAYFSTHAYLLRNRDVQMSGMNPIYHYEKYGRTENRPIN